MQEQMLINPNDEQEVITDYPIIPFEKVLSIKEIFDIYHKWKLAWVANQTRSSDYVTEDDFTEFIKSTIRAKNQVTKALSRFKTNVIVTSAFKDDKDIVNMLFYPDNTGKFCYKINPREYGYTKCKVCENKVIIYAWYAFEEIILCHEHMKCPFCAFVDHADNFVYPATTHGSSLKSYYYCSVCQEFWEE